MWENTVRNDEKAESENGIFIVIEKRLTALMIAPIVTNCNLNCFVCLLV